jgi:PII-like signaling protein
MAHQQVTIARLYLREGEHLLSKVMKFLHEEERVAGVTVLRGMTGFSTDGKIRTASLVDLSLDLPLVVEFYDEPDRVETVIRELLRRMDLSHVVTWSGVRHIKEE